MTEIKPIARHALSIWTGQLAVMLFGVTDTLVAARHSDEALAALSVGSAIYISVYVALMAMVQALLPVWSEKHGAGETEALGQSVRQALYLCGIITMLGLSGLLTPGPLMRWTGVPAALQEEVVLYLSVLALGFAPSLLFRMYSTLNQSLGRPMLVTWLQVGGLAVKIPLSIIFALGWDSVGLSGMGAVGCAWATVVVNFSLLGVAFYLLRNQNLYQPYRLWQRLEPPHLPTLRHFASLGVPTGLSVLVEITSFTLMALYIARLGTVASAAHQIGTSLVALLYMLPLSLGIAISARASFWLGAGNAHAAGLAVQQGFILVFAESVSFSALLFIAKNMIPGWYSSNPEVIGLASGLLAWVALYHFADALQAVSCFVLRSYRVVLLPFLIYAILLWGLGLGGAYIWAYKGWLGVTARPQASTFWIAGALALLLTAACFLPVVVWAVKRSCPRMMASQR